MDIACNPELVKAAIKVTNGKIPIMVSSVVPTDFVAAVNAGIYSFLQFMYLLLVYLCIYLLKALIWLRLVIMIHFMAKEYLSLLKISFV